MADLTTPPPTTVTGQETGEPVAVRRRRMKAAYDEKMDAGLKTVDALAAATAAIPLNVPLDPRAMLHRLLNALPYSPEVEAARKIISPPPPPAAMDLGATIYPQLTTERNGQVHTDKWLVCLVGAGGVGARLAPLLIKHLTNGDMFHVIDGDLVEAKNIARQHFTPSDIGQPKAQVVAMRAKATAPRDGIEVGFTPMFIDEGNAHTFAEAFSNPTTAAAADVFGEGVDTPRRSVLLITCVDTLKARKLILKALSQQWESGGNANYVSNLIWVDCGNATASGQAMVMGIGSRAALSITRSGGFPTRWSSGSFFWPCWNYILPGFLDREDEVNGPGGVDNCAIRIDPQTVLANMWAALAAASIAIPIITMAGIRTAGMGFSVTGTSITAPVSEKILVGPTSADFRMVSRKLA